MSVNGVLETDRPTINERLGLRIARPADLGRRSTQPNTEMATDAEAVLRGGREARSACISRCGAESCRAGTRGPARRPARGDAVMAPPTLQSASQIRSASGAPSEPVGIDRVATTTAVELPDRRHVSLECWPGDGAPLVLLHGLLDCAAGWKHLARMIDRPCYAFDLPGFGDSDCPTRNRISAYAEDVQAALAVLDVHDFTLVGHSLGGAVATALVERLGDDVAALVLIAPAGFGRIHLAEAIQLPGVRSWFATVCRWR